MTSSDPYDGHASWIAAARAEAEDLRRRSTVDGSSGMGRGMVQEADLRRTLQAALPGYEFCEPVFRGGQGVVFKALQKSTNRDVAIKVLRDHPAELRHGTARFDREVQILSQLKHPNIVGIVDSGTTAGHRYYIMDFIDGLSLDDYLIAQPLSTRARLELFVKICTAVNVAHLRGVIHRDLKPSNIRIDRAGQPHILDFGLAKTDEHDEFATVHTMTGQFVGSLPWASPEQVESIEGGVDVRTDVYALGVMLYCAMTGQFPYPVDTGFRTTIEHICNTPPPRPSQVATTANDEIDQIVLKALRKERDERYQTAGNFAKDIQRYLNGEAIEAKRDSNWYLLKKAARRHRIAAGVVAVFVLLLAALVLVLGYSNRQIRLARDDAQNQAQAAQVAKATAQQRATEAETARDEAQHQARIANAVTEFLNDDLLGVVAPDDMGKDVKMREVVDRAADRLSQRPPAEGEVDGQINYTLGNTYLQLGELDQSLKHLTNALRLFTTAYGPHHDNTLSVMNDVAWVHEVRGELSESIALYEKILGLRRAHFGEDHQETITVKCNLGWTYARIGDLEKADALMTECVDARRQTQGDDDRLTLTAMNNLALLYQFQQRYQQALELAEHELAASRRLLDKDDPKLYVSVSNVATLLAAVDENDRAEALFEEALATRRRILGDAHPKTLLTFNNFSTFHSGNGETDKAQVLMETACRLGTEAGHSDLPIMVTITSNLAETYSRAGNFEKALPMHRTALENGLGYLPADHQYIGIYEARLGRCLMELDQLTESEPLLRSGHQKLEKNLGLENELTSESTGWLAELCRRQGKLDEAAAWEAKLPSQSHAD